MELGENKTPPVFFASHPLPKERVKNLKEQIEKHSVFEGNTNEEKLKKITKPYLKKWLKDEIRINNKIEQKVCLLIEKALNVNSINLQSSQEITSEWDSLAYLSVISAKE